MLRLAAAALFVLVAGPAALLAQEEEADSPMIMSVSSWICPQGEIQAISESYETFTQPVERELIDEGMLVNTGLFFHAWGDEWNVNYFRIAPTMEGLFQAIGEVGSRVNERNPELADQPGPFSVCTAHKDNIYFLPTPTAMLESGG